MLLSAAAVRGEVQLSSVIGDHCVLQRGVKVPVWGRARPGEKIAVTFAGQSKSAAADRFGRWRIQLDPMSASAKGRPLVVQGPQETLRVGDVYVGDVWLDLTPCWYVGQKPAVLAGDADPAALPPLCVSRPASVHEAKNHSARPQAEFSGRPGRWGVYSAGSKYFASDAFYLGLGLAPHTRAPVGVVGLGISTLESMTPPEGFQALEAELGPLAATVAEWTPRTRRGRQAYLRRLEEIARWVEQTRPKLQREAITFRDFTQPPRLPGPPVNERGPTTLYNHVIHRFTPAAIRGAIIRPATWNVGDPQYHAKARALILGLREAFGRKDLPVCFVQMHSPMRYDRKKAKQPSDWIALRAQQGRLADLPHTTVIATYDLSGRRDGMDPDIGRRVGKWAVHLTTGKGEPTGPSYGSHRADGRRLIVELNHVGKGLMVGNAKPGEPVQPAPDAALGGFQLAGSDGRWRDAAAAIHRDTVVVTCDKLREPLAVRYAWAPEPTGANLYNRAGLAALPFNTAEQNR